MDSSVKSTDLKISANAARARSRDRRVALATIKSRLIDLQTIAMESAIRYPEKGISRVVTVFFSERETAIYFRVERGALLLMTGHLNPLTPPNYPELGLHLMTWRRGEWEVELFDDAMKTRAIYRPLMPN